GGALLARLHPEVDAGALVVVEDAAGDLGDGRQDELGVHGGGADIRTHGHVDAHLGGVAPRILDDDLEPLRTGIGRGNPLDRADVSVELPVLEGTRDVPVGRIDGVHAGDLVG